MEDFVELIDEEIEFFEALKETRSERIESSEVKSSAASIFDIRSTC